MKPRQWLATTFAVAMAIPICATASQFRTVGPRAMSMGGAGVAWPEGAFASYYNPAALALSGKTEIGLSMGINIHDTGFIEPLNKLLNLDVDWEEATKNPTSSDAEEVLAALGRIDEEDGLLVMPGAAFGVKYGSFGLGVYPTAEIGIFSSIDTEHVNPTDATDPKSFAHNTSGIYGQGLGLGEASLAYGYAFKRSNGDLICIGGAGKFIEAVTYDTAGKMTIGPDELQNQIQGADKMSATFGVDLGLLYASKDDGWSGGILARNINSPEFATLRNRTFTEDMQIRAGVAYSLTKSLYGAFDCDVTENGTWVKGGTARQLGGGLCWQATAGISLRAGVQTILSETMARPVICVGGSLGWQVFNIDLAAAIPTEWSQLEETSFPNAGGAVLAFNSSW